MTDGEPIECCECGKVFERGETVMTSGKVLMEITDKNEKLMVRVSEDGKVEYGDGYKADSVTKVFWEELAKAYPEVCEARKADRKATHQE